MNDPDRAATPATSASTSTAADTRARSISRWACGLVSVVAVGIAGITFRVVQLKTSPDPRLAAAMEMPGGRLAQERQVWDGLPRGQILDRHGRTLALDALSGTLYIDVRDLYRDTIRSNEEAARRIAAGKPKDHDRIVMDPITEIAGQLGPMLGMPQADVVLRILHRDVNAADYARVPSALSRIPQDGTLTDAEWAQLPRYVVIAKNLDDEQIRLLREAKEAGGPTSIVRAAHFEPKSERIRPYGNVGASIVGKTGIDVVGDAALAVDLRSLYRDAMEFNQGAFERIAAGEMVRVIDDPVGDFAATLAPVAGMTADEIATAILGAEFARPDVRVPRWAAMTANGGLSEDTLDEIPNRLVIKPNTTAAERARLDGALKAQVPAAALAYAKVLPGTEGVVGRSGVEQIENSRLSSKPGYTTYVASRLGSVIAIPEDGYRPGDAGDEVRLAIDIVIQEFVETRVNQMVQDANAAGGRAIVADAHTGEILAAYSTINGKSGRDPLTTDFITDDPALARMRWATDPFEPGSIFKPFVWAWAVDHGFARPSEVIHLPDGPLVLTDGRAKRTIKEAHRTSYGTKSWEQVLVKSVNAGMATIAFRMGNDEMKHCLGAWQFGLPTGVGVDGESRGIMPPAAEWTNKTRALASVSFGQGIAVTPLQLVRAFSAFCRQGDMVPLTLRPLASNALTASMPVLSTGAVNQSRVAMEKVITEGTGKKLKDILFYRAFGKSGTAQLASPKGGYFAGKYLASFIAGAPYDNPEIVVLVTIEDPDDKSKKTGGATGGGAVAGPVVAHIVNDVLGYMGSPSDGELAYAEKKDDPKKKLAGAGR